MKDTNLTLPNFVSANSFRDMARHLSFKRNMASTKNIDFERLKGKLEDKDWHDEGQKERQ